MSLRNFRLTLERNAENLSQSRAKQVNVFLLLTKRKIVVGRHEKIICNDWPNGNVACSRRSDSRARRSVGSELNHTPGKRGEKREGRGKNEATAFPPSPVFSSSLPPFFFLREFFSSALQSERLEQATGNGELISLPCFEETHLTLFWPQQFKALKITLCTSLGNNLYRGYI